MVIAMINRIKCWLGWHNWGEYDVARLSYVLVDHQNLTGLNGKIIKESFVSIRTCKDCNTEQRFSNELGWTKL
jgi:hypothetical protein